MRPTRLSISCLMLAVLSCTDQGDVVNYLEVLEVNPAPNATQVDKAAVVFARFDRDVNVNESRKIQLRYVDGTDTVDSYPGCGLTPPLVPYLCRGPFIWKPGRTVEVTIPREIADPDGNTLRQSIVYHFTIARDTVPFDLIRTQPGQDDTVTLFGPIPYASFGMGFNDYVYVRDSALTIDPPAVLGRCAIAVTESRRGPERWACFTISNLQAGATYTVTIPRTITDFEGEALPRDYHVVFHTKL